MPETNGSTAYGEATVNGLLKKDGQSTTPSQTSKEDIALVLQSFRLLIADLCQQFGMGHPGSAIGMAAIGVALWKYAMKYAPHQPDWFNRHRFLLSNGKAYLNSQGEVLIYTRSRMLISVHQSLPFGV
jgi:dihydroxyacetone synthase